MAVVTAHAGNRAGGVTDPGDDRAEHAGEHRAYDDQALLVGLGRDDVQQRDYLIGAVVPVLDQAVVGDLAELFNPDACLVEGFGARPGPERVVFGAVRSARTPLAGSSAHTRTACLPAEVTVRRSVAPPEVNSSPGAAAAAAARRPAVAVRWARTRASSAGIAGSRSRVRWSIRDLRWVLVFRNATAVSFTGLGATQAAQRPGSSAAHWAMSA